MIKGTIALAVILASGVYFSGMLDARAPAPGVAANGATIDQPGNEDTSTTPYGDEECDALKERMARANLSDPDLQTKPDSFGQALRQTAKTVTRLKQMESQLRNHGCLKPGDGRFVEPRAEMKPADPAPSPSPSFGSGESFGGAGN